MNSLKPVDVVSQSWDYLIVLDACRYDYFERFWKDYLPQGQLSCKWSPGSCTDEWRNKSFPDRYKDIVYVSANPQICASSKVYGYCAGEHFFKVFEVWKDGWDSEIGTVLPSTMTDAALEILKTIEKNKRVIIHYLQPHAPYISFGADVKGHGEADFNQRTGFIETAPLTKVSKIKELLCRCAIRTFKSIPLFGNHPDWAMRKFFKLPPKTPMEHLLQKYGVDELRDAYEENTKSVLRETARLIKHLSGKIVVSSDHGELLGENKNFSHPSNSEHPIVRNVPWLEITQDEPAVSQCEVDHEEVPQNSSQEISAEAIIERLRALGYHD